MLIFNLQNCGFCSLPSFHYLQNRRLLAVVPFGKTRRSIFLLPLPPDSSLFVFSLWLISTVSSFDVTDSFPARERNIILHTQTYLNHFGRISSTQFCPNSVFFLFVSSSLLLFIANLFAFYGISVHILLQLEFCHFTGIYHSFSFL